MGVKKCDSITQQVSAMKSDRGDKRGGFWLKFTIGITSIFDYNQSCILSFVELNAIPSDSADENIPLLLNSDDTDTDDNKKGNKKKWFNFLTSSNNFSKKGKKTMRYNLDDFNFLADNPEDPCENFFTTKPNGRVKLRKSDEDEMAALKPILVPTMLHKTVKTVPKKRALCWKGAENNDSSKKWDSWTYEEYWDQICQTAKAFINLGLQPYHGVGILGFNAKEWHVSAYATIFAGGLVAGIYATNIPEACRIIAENSKANIIIVEDDKQLQKILAVKSQLPHLKAIVQYKGQPKTDESNIYSWNEMLAKSGDTDDVLSSNEELFTRLKNLRVNQCCSLVYTSGTTGNPKGVMLSHDNITWTCNCVIKHLKLKEEILVSYLPLSHVAAQQMDIYGAVAVNGTVYFAQPDALRGGLGKTLKEVRPTVFIGVPRVWEKIVETMKAVSAQTRGPKKKIAAWAKSIGYEANSFLMSVNESTKDSNIDTNDKPQTASNAINQTANHSDSNGKKMISKNTTTNQGAPTENKSPLELCRKKRGTFSFWLANKLVFSKVRNALGLDRCNLCITAAAPIMRETVEYLMSLDVIICDLYGMSESSGPHTMSTMTNIRTGAAGKMLPGVSTVIHDPDDDCEGEICMDGRNIFMGYLLMPDKTDEATDDAGLLHSGDKGKFDDDGFLYVTGRLKEIIVTAGGENIAPVPIEDALKERLPIISNVMVVGDKKKFLSVLITLSAEIDGKTMKSTNTLSSKSKRFLDKIYSTSKTISDILKGDEKVSKAIEDAIQQVNEQAVSRACQLQKWKILPEDFSIPGGELGPTLKLKRAFVAAKYSQQIDEMYADSSSLVESSVKMISSKL